MVNNQAKINKGTGTPGQGVNPFDKPREQKRGRRSSVSEYKKSLTEKQELKNMYGLTERQFKAYVKNSLERMHKVKDVSDELIKSLEKRLDNAVFRMGFAKSRPHAHQMVSHAYFLVNGKPVNIPSFRVERGDIVAMKEGKKKKTMFEDIKGLVKKSEAPMWVKVDKEKMSAEVVGEPTITEVNPPVEISLIFEFYSR